MYKTDSRLDKNHIDTGFTSVHRDCPLVFESLVQNKWFWSFTKQYFESAIANLFLKLKAVNDNISRQL